MERTALLRWHGVEGARLLKDVVAVEVGPRLDLRVAFGNAVQQRLRILLNRQFAGANMAQDVGSRPEMGVLGDRRCLCSAHGGKMAASRGFPL